MTDSTRAPAEYTVDELARVADTMTTTVRMYQAKGLLQPPTKRGRVAFYGDAHLERLGLISALQRRGHSLAGIADLLDGVQHGVDLPELIGVRTWGSPSRITVSPAELADRFDGVALTADDLMRAAQMGLISIVADGAVSVDERFIDVGAEIVRMGIPVSEVLTQWDQLRDDAAAISARFTAAFAAHLWPSLDAASASVGEVGDVLDRLGPLAQRVVALALESALRADATAFANRISD